LEVFRLLSAIATVADAALFGDVILFSPNFSGVDDALEAAGPLKGKTVIDATNPLQWNPNGRMVRSLPGSTTAGEELAKKLPNALVVKAFSTFPASFIPHAFCRPVELQRLVVFYCGDHRLSKAAVHHTNSWKALGGHSRRAARSGYESQLLLLAGVRARDAC